MITKACAEQGNVLLSGLLTEDESEIVEACQQNGLRFIQQMTKSNWIALLFHKRE
jgi:ribosomal protein L11 methylase PrmA